MEQLIIAAETKNLPEVTAFIQKVLTEYGWEREEQFQIELAVEEIFVNICLYAYGAEGGKAEMSLEKIKEKEGVLLRIADWGIPYNPLEREEPDITLEVQERKPGGLGIFFVKQIMDQSWYEHKENKNLLTLLKYRKGGIYLC